jgi:hypothetical protein
MAFQEEYQALKKRFPRVEKFTLASDNCDWADHVYDSHNCYYAFDVTEASGCLYCYNDYKISNCIDTLWNAFCENSYELSDSANSNSCYFCQYLNQSYNMWYSYNCGNCHDCFGCVYLDNKEHCIYNVQYTEAEYNEKLKELKKLDPDEVYAKVREVELNFPKLQSNFLDNENSDYVDYVYKSNNSYYCFDANSLNDCCYVTNCNECADLYNSSFTVRAEQSSELLDSTECYNSYMLQDCARCYDSSYLYSCSDCHNCFGCVYLSNKQYCILNVQYTKEEYEQKIAEIKAEIGLFFPKEIQAQPQA